MIYNGIISGRYVDLRSATLDDAEFTLNIRLDPEIKKRFPPFDSNLEKQKIWLSNQMQKDNDYFFVIIDKQNNQRIGTISIYDINYEKLEAENGRLVVKSDNPLHSSEAFLLLNRFSFHELGLERVYGFILGDNQRSQNFNKFFGSIVHEPEFSEKLNHIIVRTELFKKDFLKVEQKIEKFLYRK